MSNENWSKERFKDIIKEKIDIGIYLLFNTFLLSIT